MEVRITRNSHEITVSLEENEERLLVNLCQQLLEFLLSYSGQGLDPDPLLASLEVGGATEPPQDIALRALFPDAFFGDAAASAEFRSTTELGLLNRKAQDAIEVLSQLGYYPNGTRKPPSREDAGAETIPPADAISPAAAEEEPENDASYSNRVVLVPADFEKWMRTLTSLRLVIAARIGVVSESDEQALEARTPEQEAAMQIMHFLGALLDFITETALEAL